MYGCRSVKGEKGSCAGSWRCCTIHCPNLRWPQMSLYQSERWLNKKNAAASKAAAITWLLCKKYGPKDDRPSGTRASSPAGAPSLGDVRNGGGGSEEFMAVHCRNKNISVKQMRYTARAK